MKPQTLALAEFLNGGGSITRESAWERFRIQNITARLSELTSTGFSLSKTPRKALVDGHAIRLTSWKFRSCITPGCRVKIIQDSGTLVALQGRTGLIESIHLSKALATVHIDHVGYRSLRFNALERLPLLAAGTPVTIKPLPYVILEYNERIDSYLLTSSNPKHTLVAHATLVEAPRAVL